MLEERAKKQADELLRRGGMRGRITGFHAGFLEGFQAGFDQARKEIGRNMIQSAPDEEGDTSPLQNETPTEQERHA